MQHPKKCWLLCMAMLVAACGGGLGLSSDDVFRSVAEMRCGSITAPLGNGPPPLGDTQDPEIEAAVKLLDGQVNGSMEDVSWSVWEKSDVELVLYGKSGDGYTHASLTREGDGWRATSWGHCTWEVLAEHWGVADWEVFGRIDPNETELTLAAHERNCANGEAPGSRDVHSVVWETEDAVTIFLFVEPVSGAATCPGNPTFPLKVQLDSPVGDRRLFDGVEVPPVERPAG